MNYVVEVARMCCGGEGKVGELIEPHLVTGCFVMRGALTLIHSNSFILHKKTPEIPTGANN